MNISIEKLKEIAKKIHKVESPSITGVPGNSESKAPEVLEEGEPFTNPDAVTGKGGGATIGNLENHSTY